MPEKPKPTKGTKERGRPQKTNRQKTILKLSDLCREITIWRDGCTCVLSHVDGGRCNDVSQWGHVVPQGASGYLKHSLSNSFRQCGSHNTLHKYNQITYLEWYRHTFGNTALQLLERASKKTYHKFSMDDLIEMRDMLKHLIDDEHLYAGASKETLIQAGYYGEIIREAWIKDGRI